MKMQTTQRETQVILNSLIGQRILSVPEDGLLVRLKIDGQRLSASFDEGDQRPGGALQIITWALQALRIDPVEDPKEPFAPYNPGSFISRPPEPATDDHDGQHATL